MMDSDYKCSMCIKRREATCSSSSIHGKSWPNVSRSADTSAYSWEANALNANANGLRVGYAASNAEHIKRVDEALTNFVNVTQGQLMSPNAPSWRRGKRGAKLDHLVTWNLSHDSSTGSLGACWRSVGSEVPEGCTELEHPALAQRLARTMTLKQHELASLLPQGLDDQRVVRVGEQVFRPVPLGQVDWLGGPQHDHARVGFRIEAQVLAPASMVRRRKAQRASA